MSDFLRSPASTVMANLEKCLGKGMTGVKLLRASSETNSSLQETVSLINQSRDKEIQDRLETDEELKILGNSFKKQMKENKSLTLKLFQTKTKKEKN